MSKIMLVKLWFGIIFVQVAIVIPIRLVIDWNNIYGQFDQPIARSLNVLLYFTNLSNILVAVVSLMLVKNSKRNSSRFLIAQLTACWHRCLYEFCSACFGAFNVSFRMDFLRRAWKYNFKNNKVCSTFPSGLGSDCNAERGTHRLVSLSVYGRPRLGLCNSIDKYDCSHAIFSFLVFRSVLLR